MHRPAGDLVSLVVIARDEARHLLGCLRSIARQSHPALDVVVVDDGSSDATMAIAERVAAADPRFRVLRLTGAGRAAARNEGVAAAHGDLLGFVDGDDLLPEDAVELLRGALVASGSDVAIGSVHRIDARGTRPAVVMPRDKAAATLPRAPELLASTTLAGRLWRRDAWEALGLRFDERLEVHEDLPVVVAAMARARAVDTVAAPVYLHRRHGRREPVAELTEDEPAVAELPAGPPIDVGASDRDRGAAGEHRPDTADASPRPAVAPPTVRAGRAQRRLEPAVVGALVAAVDQALADLAAARVKPATQRAALTALLGGELAATLRVFDLAAPEWQAAFAGAVLPWLDRVGLQDLADRPALERLGWELLRAGRHEALAMVLRTERTGAAPPAVRRRGRRHLGWAALDSVPRAATRLADEDPAIRPTVVLDELHAHGGVLELGGHARLAGAPAARVALRLVPRVTPPGLRLPASPVLLRTAATDTPGDFGTTLSPAAIRDGGAVETQTWDLWAEVTAGGTRRHTDRFAIPHAAHQTTFLPAGDKALVRATARPDGRVTLGVETRWACARRQRTALGGLLVLSGELRLGDDDPVFELRRRSDGHRRRQPLRVDRGRLPHAFEATIPLHDLAEAPAPLGTTDDEAQQVWEAWILDGSGGRRVALPADVPVAAWFVGDRVVSLLPTAKGHAVLVAQDRARLPVPAAAPARAVAPPVLAD